MQKAISYLVSLIGITVLATLMPQSVLAYTGLNVTPEVITLSFGPAWNSSGTTQVLTLLPNVQNTYVASDNAASLVDGELFVGWYKNINQQIQGQFGIAGMLTNGARLNGIIWQISDPMFDNESYVYKVQHSHIALKGKLVGYSMKWLEPYVAGSIGVGFNRAYDYTNTPLIDTVLASPNFMPNTQTTFTYTVSAGLQKAYSKHWAFGVEYQFADWGNSQLSRAPEQTLGSGLSLSHLYINALQFNASYKI